MPDPPLACRCDGRRAAQAARAAGTAAISIADRAVRQSRVAPRSRSRPLELAKRSNKGCEIAVGDRETVVRDHELSFVIDHDHDRS